MGDNYFIMKMDPDNFSTHDLTLAATLLVRGVPLKNIDKKNLKQSLFVFDRSEKLAEAVKRFWRRQELVEPLALSEQLRYLKSLIYQ